MGSQWLIVGLGNPGQRYNNTRHNVGRQTVFELGRAPKKDWSNDKKLDAAWLRLKEFADTDEEAILALPNTFMNDSGNAVRRFIKKFRIEPQRLVVVCDDVNLALGRIRVRGKGSDGGNKGLRSTINAVGSQEFARIRIGVALPAVYDDLCDYVLSTFTPEEQPVIETARNKAVEAVLTIVRSGVEDAMNQFNAA